MHIVVYGTGGVGGYFGGRLAQAGEQVTFIARGEHLSAMLASGLQVDSIKGDFLVKPVTATDDPATIKEADVVLMCVKTWQLPNAAKSILPMLGPDTFVIPLENGIQAPAQLAEILGREHVVAGLCGLMSHIASPGHIQHTGGEPFIRLGEMDNHASARTQSLLHILQHAGITASIPGDINVALWSKFIFITAVGGIGAVTRVPFGTFRIIPGVRQMMVEALKECRAVAIGKGVSLSPEIVSRTIESIDGLPPDDIASMQRDIMDGCPSELEDLNGMLVHLGQMLHIPTPVHSFIYNSLLPQEMLARSRHGG